MSEVKLTESNEEEITVVLNTLIYSELLDNEITEELENVNIYEIAKNFKLEDNLNKTCPSDIAQADWGAFLQTIIDNKETYSNLKVQDITVDVDKNMTITDDNGSVYIIYRGTGAKEWHDNAEGIYMPETLLQNKALEYYNIMVNEFGADCDNIIVSGHSKGGNKAMYVGVKEDNVTRVISFDGQGFGLDFLYANSDKIQKNKDKIINISSPEDYVNCLFFPIAGRTVFVESDRPIMDILKEGNIQLQLKRKADNDPTKPKQDVSIDVTGQAAALASLLSPGLGFSILDQGVEISFGSVLEIGLKHSIFTLLENKNGTIVLRSHEGTERDFLPKIISSFTQFAAMHMSKEDMEFFSHAAMHIVEPSCPIDFNQTAPEGAWERLVELLADFAVTKMGMDREKADQLAIAVKLIMQDSFKKRIANSVLNRENPAYFNPSNMGYATVLGNYKVILELLGEIENIEGNCDIVRNYTQDYLEKLRFTLESQNPDILCDMKRLDSWDAAESQMENADRYVLISNNYSISEFYKDINALNETAWERVDEVFSKVNERADFFHQILEEREERLCNIVDDLTRLADSIQI